jgi:hypothetical protein
MSDAENFARRLLAGGNAVQRALAVGRVAWKVTKTAACVLGNLAGWGLGVAVMGLCYVAIIAPDSMWARLAAQSPKALDPFAIRTLALAGCAFGFFIMRACGNDLALWWFHLRTGSPEERS